MLALTKADLADPAPFLENYAPLHVPPSSRRPRSPTGPTGSSAVRDALRGHVSVLIGHSGVGKSTLVNALVPDAYRAVGVVNDVTGRGRHTSTSAVALRLPDGDGWVIDTPGIRSFGLAHVDPERIVTHFPELESGTDACPRGCTHDEEECALDAVGGRRPRRALGRLASGVACGGCCAPVRPRPATDHPRLQRRRPRSLPVDLVKPPRCRYAARVSGRHTWSSPQGGR